MSCCATARCMGGEICCYVAYRCTGLSVSFRDANCCMGGYCERVCCFPLLGWTRELVCSCAIHERTCHTVCWCPLVVCVVRAVVQPSFDPIEHPWPLDVLWPLTAHVSAMGDGLAVCVLSTLRPYPGTAFLLCQLISTMLWKMGLSDTWTYCWWARASYTALHVECASPSGTCMHRLDPAC
jgi:hypothetical protein